MYLQSKENAGKRVKVYSDGKLTSRFTYSLKVNSSKGVKGMVKMVYIRVYLQSKSKLK